ncbi:MAG TPA: NAD(P)H-dependent oxidoreductase [Vicinamibacterales bacterium]
MPNLGVVIASVRERRAGAAVADWFVALARRHAGFQVDVLDLQTVGLPVLEEPEHPRLRKYRSEKTKSWSARVAAMDAFVFVTPEYNYSSPPALVNALDHLYVEWNYKPVGFVSYGGISGGLRGVQMTKQIVTSFKMVPMTEQVALPFFTKMMDAVAGTFNGGEVNEKAAASMLDELVRWTIALKVLRTG